MKKFQSLVLLFVLVFGFTTLAHAGLDDFIRRVNEQAKEDINRFNAKISAQFGIPVPKVEDIVKKVPSPADAFMVFQLGQMSNKQPDTVLHTYQASRDKGWGAIAQELGIKPGSPEFHALKRGDLHFTGQPGGGRWDTEEEKATGKGRRTSNEPLNPGPEPKIFTPPLMGGDQVLCIRNCFQEDVMQSKAVSLRHVFSLPVIVAALGYFVDIYDLILFSIVRVPSLTELGLSGQQLIDTGVYIFNMQMAGMLIGGIIWGILGDRKGRLKIMFGSIFLYSVANAANGMVHSIEAYAWLRFLAGIGLAGELGAGITLVSEVLHTSIRGYGTMLVASVGVSGAILANFVATTYDWRTAYVIGGVLGLLLLIARISVAESGMFRSMEQKSKVSRGNFLALFSERKRFLRYLNSILIGVPIWFVVGVLITFSPEFAKALGTTGPVSAGNAVMYCYLGLVFGDLTSGLLSQTLKSRKKAVLLYMLLTIAGIALYFLQGSQKPLLLLWRLPGPRIRFRILGDLRDGCRRAVRHEPARHRCHDRAELCARHGGSDHAAVQIPQAASRPSGQRAHCRRDLRGRRLPCAPLARGDVPQGPGLLRRVLMSRSLHHRPISQEAQNASRTEQ